MKRSGYLWATTLPPKALTAEQIEGWRAWGHSKRALEARAGFDALCDLALAGLSASAPMPPDIDGLKREIQNITVRDIPSVAQRAIEAAIDKAYAMGQGMVPPDVDGLVRKLCEPIDRTGALGGEHVGPLYSDLHLRSAAAILSLQAQAKAAEAERDTAQEKWTEYEEKWWAADERAEKAEAQAKGAAIIPMLLWCPWCGERHVDKGEFATKPHHTHACQNCGMVWRPAIEPSVGVQFLPGFKDARP